MWRFIRAAPKWALTLGLIAAAIVILVVWQIRRSAQKAVIANVPIIAEKVKKAEERIIESWPRMVLIDNDLYDTEDGTPVFRNWLKEGMPGKLFWESETKTVLAEYERGFVRYAPDGTIKASLPLKTQFAIGDDRKWIVFGKDKDIWRADLDWKELKLVNERKLTSIAQFNDQNFARNIMIGTDKTLIVRNVNQVLRVNMETGAVHPTKLPMLEIGKRRSPDSRSVVGLQGDEWYCYDLDTDEAKSVKVGRGQINDYQWLDNDHCVAIAAGTKLVGYDRKQNTLTELFTLPAQCSRVEGPSPDGRFVFCYSFKGGFLVDVERKTATAVTAGAGITWVSNETYAFSRDVADSDLRGSWFQTVGRPEKRISTEPFNASNGGASLQPISSGAMLMTATKGGLATLKPDGSEFAVRIPWSRIPERIEPLHPSPF